MPLYEREKNGVCVYAPIQESTLIFILIGRAPLMFILIRRSEGGGFDSLAEAAGEFSSLY